MTELTHQGDVSGNRGKANMELIERLEKADGPDRELDLAVAWSVERDRYRAAYWNGRTGKPTPGPLPDKLDGLARIAVWAVCPHYTASIDAALALVERKLPGCRWSIDRTDEGDPDVWFDVTVNEAFVQKAHSAPLAILLALLKALNSESSDVL